jgi:hypothetical protein
MDGWMDGSWLVVVAHYYVLELKVKHAKTILVNQTSNIILLVQQ